jgi:hypothetical protein
MMEPSDDDDLYQVALAVDTGRRLAAEMAEWEAATVVDGLDGYPPYGTVVTGSAGRAGRSGGARFGR